ncbi:hypothetical protein SAMN02745866_03677 [Alteromonadaceae bacterium Bs31]|nr:hypothetical protein SAMN02745866_03677 [Alteromonadaceae bacterium Bs31]
MVSSVELYLTEKCVIASVGFLKYRAAELEDDGFYIFAVDIPVKEENCNEKDEEKKCKSYIGYQRLFQKDFRLAPNSEYFSKKSIRDVVFYDVEGKFVVFQMPDRVVQFSLDFPLLVDDL